LPELVPNPFEYINKICSKQNNQKIQNKTKNKKKTKKQKKKKKKTTQKQTNKLTENPPQKLVLEGIFLLGKY
jgi:hypothetical protein